MIGGFYVLCDGVNLFVLANIINCACERLDLKTYAFPMSNYMLWLISICGGKIYLYELPVMHIVMCMICLENFLLRGGPLYAIVQIKPGGSESLPSVFTIALGKGGCLPSVFTITLGKDVCQIP